MPKKKINITKRPTPSKIDSWVSGGEPRKRLTIDMPESLHCAIKSQCALRGVSMADEIRELLQKQYGS